MYQEVFEIEFLRETETMYRAEALRMMRDPEFTVSCSSVIPQSQLFTYLCKSAKNEQLE